MGFQSYKVFPYLGKLLAKYGLITTPTGSGMVKDVDAVTLRLAALYKRKYIKLEKEEPSEPNHKDYEEGTEDDDYLTDCIEYENFMEQKEAYLKSQGELTHRGAICAIIDALTKYVETLDDEDGELEGLITELEKIGIDCTKNDDSRLIKNHSITPKAVKPKGKKKGKKGKKEEEDDEEEDDEEDDDE